jgi:hypothetical protein
MVILTATIFFISGEFSLLMGVIFGFICFGLAFMGMMSVLPTIVHDDSTVTEIASVPAAAKREAVSERLRAFVDAWSENGVEIRKPNYR